MTMGLLQEAIAARERREAAMQPEYILPGLSQPVLRPLQHRLLAIRLTLSVSPRLRSANLAGRLLAGLRTQSTTVISATSQVSTGVQSGPLSHRAMRLRMRSNTLRSGSSTGIRVQLRLRSNSGMMLDTRGRRPVLWMKVSGGRSADPQGRR